MSSRQGVKGGLVDIQAIIDKELQGSISDGDYLCLVNVLKIVYDKNVRSGVESVEDISVETSAIIEQEKNTACITIQNMWRKFKSKKKSQYWIDKENENILGVIFDEDEKTWSLQYLERSWKNMYRKHYDLGLFDPIPGDKISLSYWDFVSLSRGSFGR